MAKGDKAKVQNAIDYNYDAARQTAQNLQGENTQRTTQFQNLYSPAVQQNLGSYGDIMGGYQGFLNRLPNSGNLLNQFLGGSYNTGQGGVPQQPQQQPQSTGDPNRDRALALYAKYGVTPGARGSGLSDIDYWSQDAINNAKGDADYVFGRLESNLQGRGPDVGGGGSAGGQGFGALSPAIGGYGEFAQTGGYSPQDIENIRARMIAPIRSIYSSARQNVERAKALNPTLTNIPGAEAKLAREQSYALTDKTTDAEAALAEAIRSGKLAGLGGLTNIGMGARGQDLQAMLGSGGQALQGLSGMTGLYGTEPGLSRMFGQQMLTSAGQGIDVGQLRNAIASGAVNAQLGASRVPGNFQTALGNIGGVVGLGGQVAGALMGLPSFSNIGQQTGMAAYPGGYTGW
jgi:hypothetical protein